MGFCILGFIYAAFLLPELKGRSLEEVDKIFGDNSGAEDAARRERVAKQIGLDKVAQEVKHDERVGGDGKPATATGRRFESSSDDERTI